MKFSIGGIGMARRSNLKVVEIPQQEADLRVAENPIKKCKPYNDIDLNNWKDYSNVKTDTLWLFPERDNTGRHSNEYLRGGCRFPTECACCCDTSTQSKLLKMKMTTGATVHHGGFLLTDIPHTLSAILIPYV